MYKKSTGRYWSCPLNRNRNRITLHRPAYGKVGTNMWKSLSQVHLEPTTSICSGRCSTDWATVADDYTAIMWSGLGLWSKCGHAVYSQWKYCIVGYYCNRIEACFADKLPSLNLWSSSSPFIISWWGKTLYDSATSPSWDHAVRYRGLRKDIVLSLLCP